ncbi:MAG: hypothetical protein FH751_07345 [Firmicutes bacterium]|nr:hypothetical protein [Bacillota bacterium]
MNIEKTKDTENFSMRVNKNTSGILKIALTSDNPIKNKGNLVNLKFDVADKLGETTIDIKSSLINEEDNIEKINGKVIIAIKGDVDKNNVVDEHDLNILKDNCGKTNYDIDLNGDGLIDIYDLLIVANNIGERKIVLENTYPKNEQKNFYPRYSYMYLKFNEIMKLPKDISDIKIVSKDDKKVNIDHVELGVNNKDHILFIINNKLKLDTSYNIFIPKNTFKSDSEVSYDKDIIIKFKTPKTVLKGHIKTDINIKGSTIFLIDSNDNIIDTNPLYEGYIFKNMDGGEYTLRIQRNNGRIYEKEIYINEDILN